MRVAVLDDYQSVAQRYADWASLPQGSAVEFFHDHLKSEAALVERLASFDAIVAMRERTPFPGLGIAATAKAQAARDDRSAQRSDRRRGSPGARYHRVGHGRAALSDGRADLGADPGRGSQATCRRPSSARRPLANVTRDRAERQDARATGARSFGLPSGVHRQRIRHAGHRLEPEPHARTRPSGRR